MSAPDRFLRPTVLTPANLGLEWISRSALWEWLSYLMVRMFSCWHRKMSRPFTHDGCTYRACLRCGMRRNFDLRTWKTNGRYYTAQGSEHSQVALRRSNNTSNFELK